LCLAALALCSVETKYRYQEVVKFTSHKILAFATDGTTIRHLHLGMFINAHSSGDNDSNISKIYEENIAVNTVKSRLYVHVGTQKFGRRTERDVHNLSYNAM